MRHDIPSNRWLEKAMESFGEHGGVAHREAIGPVVGRLKQLYIMGATYELAGQQAAMDFRESGPMEATWMPPRHVMPKVGPVCVPKNDLALVREIRGFTPYDPDPAPPVESPKPVTQVAIQQRLDFGVEEPKPHRPRFWKNPEKSKHLQAS
jgi:hypothetical protein